MRRRTNESVKRLNSIQGRVLLAAVLLFPIVFSLAGFTLYHAYQTSLEVAAQERLKLQSYLLLGSADLDGGELMIPAVQQEPRYMKPGSGLYAVIYNAQGEQVWLSPSATSLEAVVLDGGFSPLLAVGETSFSHNESRRLYRFQLSVEWGIPDLSHGNAEAVVFHIHILESDQNTDAALRAYTQQLILWLALTLVLALVAQWCILRWGLKPLANLALEITHIEQGDKRHLDGAYPREIEPLTRNLNQLFENEKAQRDRYRNTLGNLAHSLKTPLALIRGAGDTVTDVNAYHMLVDEQVERMDQVVHYQLSRSVNAQAVIVYEGVEIKPLLERMVSALTKVYHDKPMAIIWNIQGDPVFKGDERDLMELFGNILENGFKYGRERIRLSAVPEGRG
ncbi:MAG: two-component sensor histidine kinase [Pontibacterium sp.]